MAGPRKRDRRRIKADGRGAMARRFRELRAALLADMGGASAINARQSICIERLARLVVEREAIDAAQSAGAAMDAASVGKLDSSIIRLIGRLGLDKTQPKQSRLAAMLENDAA